MAMYNIGEMRRPYNDGHKTFTEEQLVSKEPFGQFTSWFDEARNSKEILEANAMCLATATESGIPSARIVLLKGFNKEGFSFYTKYTSRKGEELEMNDKASLCFYWETLRRSVRIEGVVKQLPEEVSKEYFSTRPRDSQVAAVVSCLAPKVIPNREVLMENVKKIEKEYENKSIPKPKDWGGYILVPNLIEFWQGQTDRTHDRIIFRRKLQDEVLDPNLTKEGEEGWLIERLSP